MSELSLWESPVTFPVDFSLSGSPQVYRMGEYCYLEVILPTVLVSGISDPECRWLNFATPYGGFKQPEPSNGSSVETATLANGNFVACFSGNFSGKQKLYWYMYNSDGELINTKNIQGDVSKFSLSAIPMEILR